jgi:ribosome modulation factor
MQRMDKHTAAYCYSVFDSGQTLSDTEFMPSGVRLSPAAPSLAPFSDRRMREEPRMKRQKRNRVTRAYTRGYQAGLAGRSRDMCPFDALNARTSWLNGWREGFTDHNYGFHGAASVHNLKDIN